MKDNPTIKSILSILKKNCPPELERSFNDYLSKNTGILLNERMRNFPPEVMPPLFNSLQEDIKWALEVEMMHCVEGRIVTTKKRSSLTIF